MELLSVIVPVFNVETYLNKCIYSLVNQTYTNLEIILINDGSTDNTPNICNQWALKDKRIRVIHQSNMGGGHARNVGLDVAKGTYVTFVDSDDYVSESMFELLISKFNNDIDIVECDYLSVNDDFADFDNLYPKPIFHEFDTTEAMKEHINDCIFRQLIWNKVYRRSTIGRVRFPVGTKIDDEFFTYRVIGNARRLLRSNVKLYAYRQQQGSVMHSLNIDDQIQAINAKVERINYLNSNFISLVNIGKYNLWMNCIYLGQCILRDNDLEDANEKIKQLNAVIKKNSINLLKTDVGFHQKIWLMIASFSFLLACKLRNAIGIGI